MGGANGRAFLEDSTSDVDLVSVREDVEDSDEEESDDGTAGAAGLLFARHRRARDRTDSTSGLDRNNAFPRFYIFALFILVFLYNYM